MTEDNSNKIPEDEEGLKLSKRVDTLFFKNSGTGNTAVEQRGIGEGVRMPDGSPYEQDKAHRSPAYDATASFALAHTTPEIGAIENTGKHKGEIYGGIFPDGKPGWILEEPKPLTHYDAVELKGRALPTSKEGKYIDSIKDKGALKDIFARHSDVSSFAGYFWLAEHGDSGARFQQFSDGSQDGSYDGRLNHLPILCVIR
jgi:hypothetical protein